MIALIGLYLLALAIINHDAIRPKPAQAETDHISSTDDLSAELRRCNALGPQDSGSQDSATQASDYAHCRAIWAENRRRFFGLRVHSLMPAKAPDTRPTKTIAAPQAPITGTGGAAR